MKRKIINRGHAFHRKNINFVGENSSSHSKYNEKIRAPINIPMEEQRHFIEIKQQKP